MCSNIKGNRQTLMALAFLCEHLQPFTHAICSRNTVKSFKILPWFVSIRHVAHNDAGDNAELLAVVCLNPSEGSPM